MEISNFFGDLQFLNFSILAPANTLTEGPIYPKIDLCNLEDASLLLYLAFYVSWIFFYQPKPKQKQIKYPTIEWIPCLDPHVDLCVEPHVDPSVDPCVDLHVDPCLDPSVDPHVDSCADHCVDPHVNVYSSDSPRVRWL